MIFYKEDVTKTGDKIKTVIIKCNCGCGQEFHITKSVYKYDEGEFNNDTGEWKESTNESREYEFSSHSSNWYTEQEGPLSIIWKRIKRAWSALRGKDYLYQDVCLTENEYDELINELSKLKK